MSIGTWSPERSPAPTGTPLPADWLTRFTALGRDHADRLAEALSTAEQTAMAACMRTAAADWQAAVADLDSEALWHLIRFLTAAEMQLPGWQAGAASPVIALNRLLRQRGTPLTREQLQWIRAHSDNRFLPNGAL